MLVVRIVIIICCCMIIVCLIRQYNLRIICVIYCNFYLSKCEDYYFVLYNYCRV